MSLYGSNGQINTTSVSGSSYTGLQAADGSYNIVINNNTVLLGLHHPCGAYNAVVVTDPSAGYYAANGSINVIANGNSPSGYSPVQPAGVPSSIVYMLDNVTVTPAVAYSTRKLRSAYAGSALRVQRSSDAAQTDIGFATNGQLDSTALSTFIGATNGSVVTWYDQSTHANNATSGTTAPLIVVAGTIPTLNGNPALQFGVTGNSSLIFTVSLSQPTTIGLASKLSSQKINGNYTDGHTGPVRQIIGVNTGDTQYNLFAGTTSIPGGTLDLLSHSLIGIFNGASSSLVLDGTTIFTGNPGASGMTSQTIGGGDGGGGITSINGWIGDYIVFPSVLGSTDQATIRTNWQSQWGTQ